MGRLVQPLKWHGGKHYMAHRIIALMPQHVHYVEPFAGGLAVMLAKPWELIEGHSEVVNDVDRDLINLWRVLQNVGMFQAFCRQVQAIPMSEAHWREGGREGGRGVYRNVDRAVAFFVKMRQSRQGLGRDFATMSRTRTRRGMNEQASSWLTAVEGLPEVHERLKRVVIMNPGRVEPAVIAGRSADAVLLRSAILARDADRGRRL